jgi:hypothetical protein
MPTPASTVDFYDPELPLPVLRTELLRLKALAPELGQVSTATIPALQAYQKAMAEAAPRLLHETYNSSAILQDICEQENAAVSAGKPAERSAEWREGYKTAVAVVLTRFIMEYVK